MRVWINILAATALLGGTLGVPSDGCGKTPTMKSGNYSITINNKSRYYLLHLPDNYNSSHPYRLIFTFHALGGTADQVMAGTSGYLPWYGLPPMANDTLGAIFIAPNGLNKGFSNDNGDDITMTDEIIKTVEADLCVNQNLRFSTGFSYGGAMSYALACARAKEFRAVGVLSGGPMSGCVGGNDPIAYYAEHGVSDNVLNISTGHELRDRFVKNNGCTPQTPQEPAAGSGTHVKTEYAGCSADHPVTWVAFDGSHSPQPMDKGASKTFAPDETWKFFAQFT
jgi:poly(3-hydroxybutyrate) depolymerase